MTRPQKCTFLGAMIAVVIGCDTHRIVETVPDPYRTIGELKKPVTAFPVTLRPQRDSMVANYAILDTLGGWLEVDLQGFSAEISAGSWGSRNSGIPWVNMNEFGRIQIGYQIPTSADGYCSGPTGFCEWATMRSADCETLGTTVDSWSQHGGVWPSGARGDGTLEKFRQCTPPSGGGGGDGGGTGQTNCTTYIIERSDDGGNTWREWQRITVCG